MTEVLERSSRLDLLNRDGEMGALIRTHDWPASPLGAPEAWPDALRSALLICLKTPIVMATRLVHERIERGGLGGKIVLCPWSDR